MNFLELGLSEKIVKAINEHGIKRPTTVQIDVIPSILEGRDVFTIAPQRCGKTYSYIFPLLDIISKHNGQNILIITPSPEDSVVISDKLSIFNKYHNISETTIKDGDEDVDGEANVIIGSPDLLIEISEDGKLDLSNTNILVVDDINIIKKNKQLDNLKKILEILPSNKQNIVYTNRRSRETQEILDMILKAPEEIKVDKDKELEAEKKAAAIETPMKKDEFNSPRHDRRENNHNGNRNNHRNNSGIDDEAYKLSKRNNSFGGKPPKFIFSKSVVADID